MCIYLSAKSLQSWPTLCDLIDDSPPGSPVPGILQARTLEWIAISFSNAGKWKVKVKLLSRVWLLATPWTVAYQAPASMGFSRQEYWSEVPLPSLYSVAGIHQSYLTGHEGCVDKDYYSHFKHENWGSSKSCELPKFWSLEYRGINASTEILCFLLLSSYSLLLSL